jgi:hypothetical protein
MLQAVKRYLKGSAAAKLDVQAEDPQPKAGPSKSKKAKPLYTIRDVLKELHRPAIDAEIPFKSTHPDYLGSYQRAVTTVWEKMDEEDAQEVRDTVDEWNANAAPSEVQLKWVFTNFLNGLVVSDQ